MEENIFKQSNQQGTNFQNIQTNHAAQLKTNKQPNQKKKKNRANDLNRHFSKDDI